MDFENSNLTSVFAHNSSDPESASESLLQKLSGQVNGKLLRISPHAFIYMSHGEDTNDNAPCCHMVTTTDQHHYVGSLPVEMPCDEDGSCTTIALASDVLGNDDADAAPQKDAPVISKVESVNTMPTAYVVPVQSVNAVIPHTNSDQNAASALIEQAMIKKYSGTVVRHSPTAFTHVRSNGTVDRVNTNGSNHAISSHMIM